MTPERIRIAHDALCRSGSPILRHYRRGRFAVSNGAYYSGSVLPGPGFNFASCVDPTGSLAEVVEFGREFFADATDGWGILVEGGAGHPIEAEILAVGWPVAEDEPAYVIEHLDRPPATDDTSLLIRPLRDEADRLTFGRICTAAYNAPPGMSDLMMPSLAFATDPEMCWRLAESAGEPVAAGGYYRVGATAIVGGLATLESHRGQGIASAIIDHVLAYAVSVGCVHACLRSGPQSIPLYERHGFRYACQHRTYAVPT